MAKFPPASWAVKYEAKELDTEDTLGMNFGRASLGLALLLALSACSELPVAGPSSEQIKGQSQTSEKANFELIAVTPDNLTQLGRRPHKSLLSSFGDQRSAPDLRIGVGDSVVVNIWDAFALAPPSGGIIAVGPAGGRIAPSTVPEQMVARDGTISVPFGGQVKVLGMTTERAQQVIRKKLSGTLQDPQVQVTVARSNSNGVTVIGDAGGGARFPLSLGGDRLLDVLAQSGVMKMPLYQAAIQLTREDTTVEVPSMRVLRDPRENIYVQPGDVIAVMRRNPKFVAFGATGINKDFAFDEEELSLSQALGKAGGLIDLRADPGGVFVFRQEYREIVASVKGDSPLLRNGSELIPVVYQIDLRQAGGFFQTQNFPIEDRDILYVANAPANELQKFLTLLNLVTQPVVTGASIRSLTRN